MGKIEESSWKDNFKASNFFPSHDDPESFIISQWQPNKDTPSWVYLFFRLAIFITFFVIWILTYTMESAAGKPRWPVFLTNWGMTMCVLQSFLACLMLSCSLLGKHVFDAPELTNVVLGLYKTYWVINVMATIVAFTITFIYWTLIYAATGSYWSTMNFMVHGFNSLLMLLDLCIVSHPVRLLHFIYPILIMLVYLLVTIIFYVCGGTMKDGSRYIYPILKWDEPGTTTLYCLAVMILASVMHVVIFFVYKARTKLAQLWFGDFKDPSNIMYAQGSQMI